MAKKKVAAKAAVEEARAATLTSPEELMGTLVWWSISDVLIARDEFKKRVAELGLDAERFLINSRPRSAFRRALEEAEAMNLIRKITDNPETIVFGIVNETADATNLALNYETQDVVIFHKADQSLTFKMEKADADRIRKEFDKYLNSFTSHEIRSMIHGELRRLGSFPVRDKGGIYFVPTEHMETIEKMTKLVDGLNGSYIFVMGVRNQEKEKEGMKRSWDQALEQEIKSLKAEIDATLDEGTRVREATLTKRTTTLNELKAKVGVYNKLFGNGNDKVLKELDDLLGQVDAARKVKFGEAQGKRKVKQVAKKQAKAEAQEVVSDVNAALAQAETETKPVEVKEPAEEEAKA